MWHKITKALSISLMLAAGTLPEIASAICVGTIPNPVTDVCWTCVFPLKVGGMTVADFNMPDAGDAAPAVCACPAPPPVFIRFGIGTSFWEAARSAEAVRDPFCSTLLGGVSLASLPGIINAGGGDTDHKGNGSYGHYQVHWYVYPLNNWMSLLTDTACMVPESFDVLMLSELEPTWQDDELAVLFSPEVFLFLNMPAQAACIADCIASSVGFPLDPLFWCAGCQGSVYPMSGNVSGHSSGLVSALLAIQRMHTKLHRSFVAMDMGSKGAMCLPLPLPIIFKSRYKTQMLYPIPITFMAHPYGRSTSLWGLGKEFPIRGEDYGFLIWRKRVCCAF